MLPVGDPGAVTFHTPHDIVPFALGSRPARQRIALLVAVAALADKDIFGFEVGKGSALQRTEAVSESEISRGSVSSSIARLWDSSARRRRAQTRC